MRAEEGLYWIQGISEAVPGNGLARHWISIDLVGLLRVPLMACGVVMVRSCPVVILSASFTNAVVAAMMRRKATGSSFLEK